MDGGDENVFGSEAIFSFNFSFMCSVSFQINDHIQSQNKTSKLKQYTKTRHFKLAGSVL